MFKTMNTHKTMIEYMHEKQENDKNGERSIDFHYVLVLHYFLALTSTFTWLTSSVGSENEVGSCQ